MFNKSLFKQSCKANGTMWIVITVAVCFMLCCVMLIAGDDALTATKTSIQNTIIDGELTSQTEARAVGYYNVANAGIEAFDKEFSRVYVKEYSYTKAYRAGKASLDKYIDEEIARRELDPASQAALELRGAVLTVFNPVILGDGHMFDSFYKENGEAPARYDVMDVVNNSPVEHKAYRQNYIMKNSIIFIAGNMVKDENIELVLAELEHYGVSREQYSEFGFDDYNKVKSVATDELVHFRAAYDYRMAHIKKGESEQGIIEELTKDSAISLLSSLPKEVGEALDEIGQADLYGILVGSIFFKMAGLLLPIIYLIMTSNALIAGQVDSGSMAYILSSSVKRRTVTFTEAVYLIGSLLAMFASTSIMSMICLACVNVPTSLTYGNLLLINLGAFLVMFAMSGICFFASCWFNRSKHSMAIGGGINMFFLVATMLGLFGSSIIPSIIRMKALNMFNYVSIISLFDVISILEGGYDYLWKFAILIVIGIVGYVIGGEKFARKDLPL